MSPNAEETSESCRIGMKADDELFEESPALRGLSFFELNPPLSTSGDICPRLVLRCPSAIRNTEFRELIEERGETTRATLFCLEVAQYSKRMYTIHCE